MADAPRKRHQLPLAAGEGAFLAALVSAVLGFNSTAVGLSIAGLILFAVALGLWLWGKR